VRRTHPTPRSASTAVLLALTAGILSAEPLDTMMVLEMYPGTEQAVGLIRPNAFPDGDRAGTIGFTRTAQMLQPLSDTHEEIAAGLRRSGVRAGIQAVPAGGAPQYTIDLAAALKMAIGDFESSGPAGRRRAILLLFASEDAGLAPHMTTLKDLLRVAQIKLYAVVVQRTNNRPPAGRPPAPFPTMTAQLVNQLTDASGGKIYRRNWDLGAILADARK